jgi:hypothetical protein
MQLHQHKRFEAEKSRSGGYVTVREGPDGELYGLRPQELNLQDADGAVTVVNADVGESHITMLIFKYMNMQCHRAHL